MIIKGTNIIGHKIITIDNGQEIGKVNDIIYDPTVNKITAFLVDKGGIFSDAKIILMDSIQSIGEDAVLVPSSDVIKKVSDINQEKISNIANGDNYLTKTKVVTENGKEIGSINDLYFNSDNGNVEEFQVSDGLIQNIKSGTRRVKVTDIVTIGKDATIVKGYTEEKIEQQGQNNGAQGMINDLSQKTNEVIDRAKEKSSELKENMQDKIENLRSNVQNENNQQRVKEGFNDFTQTAKEKFEQVKENVQNQSQQTVEELKQNRKEEVIGQYVKTNILADNDEILAMQGEMITHELINKAEKKGLLDKILNNSSKTPLNFL
jgi:uncharacterized protein YrrD